MDDRELVRRVLKHTQPLSAFTEPLAQVRRFVEMRDASKGRQDALAALAQVERHATDMETALRYYATAPTWDGGQYAADVLSSREEGADTR